MLLAYDPGYGNIKLYGESGAFVMQSAVSVGDAQRVSRMTGLRRANAALRVRTKTGTFHVGSHAHDWGRPVENLDFERLTGSPEMMALWYGAMARYGAQGHALEVIVGLPIHVLMGEAAGAVQQAVRDALRGEHRWEADGEPCHVEVSQVRISSQPVGAMFDYLLEDDGSMPASRRSVFRGEIAVLGIGMNTLDMLVVRNGSPVQRFTGGQTLGVRRLLELVNQEGLYSLAEMDDQLRARQLDISAALPVWQSEVIGYVEKQWGSSPSRFGAVVVVGGGAVLLSEALQRRYKDKAHIPDDPVISTARGLYKYLLMHKARHR